MRAMMLVLIGVAGCTSQPFEVAGVREAQAAEVVECSFIGRVRGIPGVYGPLAGIGQKDARRAAKEKALEEGGNTVVFDPIPEGEVITELPALIYSC